MEFLKLMRCEEKKQVHIILNNTHCYTQVILCKIPKILTMAVNYLGPFLLDLDNQFANSRGNSSYVSILNKYVSLHCIVTVGVLDLSPSPRHCNDKQLSAGCHCTAITDHCTVRTHLSTIHCTQLGSGRKI